MVHFLPAALHVQNIHDVISKSSWTTQEKHFHRELQLCIDLTGQLACYEIIVNYLLILRWRLSTSFDQRKYPHRKLSTTYTATVLLFMPETYNLALLLYTNLFKKASKTGERCQVSLVLRTIVSLVSRVKLKLLFILLKPRINSGRAVVISWHAEIGSAQNFNLLATTLKVEISENLGA